ncbi:MAG TPA: sigma-54 dependent transcriptional regulator, partial [bacterium]|nr:sigma-54 dependent transcriptional regulator [bacterium]
MIKQSLSSLSILVVDDEADMRLALSAALSRAGCAVEVACSGLEALYKLEKQTFDVVISDVRMPHVSGLDVLHKAKEQNPQVSFIMITAYGTIENAVEAMREGATDYILKPFSVEILEDAVRRVCKRKERMSGSEEFLRRPQEVLCKGKREIITADAQMLSILEMARNIAISNATVLIQGESGTGKELLARYIHSHSPRGQKLLVAVNCAALPEGLLESELFGHERGAFTGAVTRKPGKFELADGGTLLLDEVSEMPFPLQAKLLRVLQEHEVDRVGGRNPIPVDLRVIATTNRNLLDQVRRGGFREDLYYRLNVVPLMIPPLRDRPGDIPLVADHLIQKVSTKNSRPIPRLRKDAMDLLCRWTWKGNVRELENVLERAVLLCNGEGILPQHIRLEDQGVPGAFLVPAVESGSPQLRIPVEAGVSVREMERELISRTLEEVG